MRTILRGSMPSTPDIGHALAQLPHVMQASPQEGPSISLPDGIPNRAHVLLVQSHFPAHERRPRDMLELKGRTVYPKFPANSAEISLGDQVSLSGYAAPRKPPTPDPVANRVPVHSELICQLANSDDYHDNSSI